MSNNLSDYKQCSKCKRLLKKSAFYINQSTPDNLNYHCVACVKKIDKQTIAKSKKIYKPTAKYLYKYAKYCPACRIKKNKLKWFDIQSDMFCKSCIRYKSYLCKKVIRDDNKKKREIYEANRNIVIQFSIANYFIEIIDNNKKYYKDYNDNFYSYMGMLRIIKNNYKFFSKKYLELEKY